MKTNRYLKGGTLTKRRKERTTRTAEVDLASSRELMETSKGH